MVQALHTVEDGNGEESWLSRCQHHLCTPNQQPAWYYLCDATNRTWSLTFLAGEHWPANTGVRVQNANEPVGHASWSGSVIRGLKKLGSEGCDPGNWNYNPSHTDMLNDIIWTDNCTRARKAVRSGVAHRTKFVVCGAVGTTWQNPEDFTDPNTGFIIAPSSWVADRFRGQRVPVRILVSGVDSEFYKPSMNANKGADLVIYMKTKFSLVHPFVQSVNTTFVEKGWNVLPIVYGNYDRDVWKGALNRAKAAIFMTYTESQCIAMSEAWSMDVPTFVYEGNQMDSPEIYGRHYPQVNAGPYINYLNGARWSTIEGLVNLIGDMSEQPMAPRDYVLNTMTDEIAVRNALRAMECEWRTRLKKSRLE